MESPFPLPLSDYASAAPGAGLLDVLSERIEAEPFNLVATLIFLLAILHTFAAKRLTVLAHHVQDAHNAREFRARREPSPSIVAEFLHFLGEIEVIFGLWAVILAGAIAWARGWGAASHYLNDSVTYTEPLFVFVIMALASTQPVLDLAEDVLRKIASIGKGSPTAWWLTILTVAPVMGSFVTEPAAMTIGALLLSKQFFALGPSLRLSYATIGLLFTNISVGGTLTHFAAPPVLMVARPWSWDFTFMVSNFGLKAVIGIVTANVAYLVLFRKDLNALQPAESTPAKSRAPWIVVAVHLGFMAWTVANAHYPAIFIAGFLFFLGFAKATSPYQSVIDLKPPLLVAFFLAGLVVHGGLQGWWIQPVLASLSVTPLFFGALVLTAFNDNALITFLATLVPSLDDAARYAVVAGAVTGGGLTVIANAPNPAGIAILRDHFEDGISPLMLALGALIPTIIMSAAMLLL
ncbi:MAG: putative Na+/H+ antiporter [Vicinamibacteria bacterium]|nr:putative Na+/H+ antiporter [Vicinamibacteria bacterium]